MSKPYRGDYDVNAYNTVLFCAPIFNGFLCRWRTLLPLAHDVTQRTLFSPKKMIHSTCLVYDLFIVYGVIMYRRRATTFPASQMHTCQKLSFYFQSLTSYSRNEERKKEKGKMMIRHFERLFYLIFK